MPIGPALPPHLAKRKRDSDSADSDSDSEKRKRTIGPSLPAPATVNPDAIDLEDSSDDDGPQPAPSLGPSLPAKDEAPKPRVIGPALPPPDMQNESEDEESREKEEESSDDDDIGPALPSASNRQSKTDEAYDTRPSDTVSQPSAQLQRDDWMLAAPSGGDWTGRVDPTKLRNRKFNMNARGGGAPSAGSSGADMWSETPEQKRQRLQNQVLGVAEPGQGESLSQPSRSARGTEDEEKERRVREYNEKHRGESLYKKHQGSRDKEEEDDPSKRAFDREKDIAGGMKLSHAKQRELLSKAGDFGSRFAKGSYL